MQSTRLEYVFRCMQIDVCTEGRFSLEFYPSYVRTLFPVLFMVLGHSVKATDSKYLAFVKQSLQDT